MINKVKPGDPLKIPAATFNTMIDAAEDYLRRSHDRKNRKQPMPLPADLVLAKNSSGVDCPRFGVLGIVGPLFDPPEDPNADNPFVQQVVLDCGLPSDATRMVIAVEPIASGQVGRVHINGLSQVKVLVNDAEHPCARAIEDDVTQLETCAAGFGSVPLLWLQAGTGTVWGLVRVGRHDSAYLQAVVPPDDAVSLQLAPDEGIAGEVYLSGDPYGVEQDEKILRVVLIEETGYSRIQFLHNALAARSLTPAYEIPYKNHDGSNRYLHLDAWGHVIGWGIENAL